MKIYWTLKIREEIGVFNYWVKASATISLNFYGTLHINSLADIR